jgi:hypothetical protein
MKTLEAAKRFVRGPAVSGLLQRQGINPRQYWLLVDLFGALSERRERMGQLGRSGILLKTIAILYGALTGLLSLGMASARADSQVYLAAFVGITSFLLFSILVSEVSNTLINPVEALVLAHQPINGATYTAANLSHLLRILLYLVPGLNAVPAFMGLTLKQTRWSYPLIHLVAAFAAGLAVALVCCGIFGWLVRFVPTPRLKAAAQTAEFLPALLVTVLGPARRLFGQIHLPSWLAVPWTVQLALALLILGVAIAGIRCLSLDYLVRVSSMVHTGSAAKTRDKQGTGFVGGLVHRFFGGQAARAGFEFVRRLMARDWQVRRQLIGLAPSLVMFAALVGGGWRASPFSGKFTALHFLPHAFGFVLLGVCSALVYGSDYKAVWVFLLIPAPAFRQFGAGVFSAIWLLLVVAPHLALLPLLSYAWGVQDASVFVAFSFAIVSFYLSMEIRLIDGVPFGRQLQANRGALMFPILIGYMAVSGMVVAVQYLLIFHSIAAVLVTTVAAGTAAWLGTRHSLGIFETAMRHHLGTLSSESTMLYQEIP